LLSVRFLGHAAFYLEGDSFSALVDPFISGNPAAKGAEGIRPQWIFVTHGHGDHLGDTVDIARESGATVVCNYELSLILARRGVRTMGMYFAGRTPMPFGSVRMVKALHGSGVDLGDTVAYGGLACGFVIEACGVRVYHAGDTGLTADMGLLAQEGIDLALLPIGGFYVMDCEDAARAVSMIKPKKVVPMHYDTFPPIKADPKRFSQLVGDEAETVILSPGESLTIG
jgi:L-ascorbate metabolism protein UlaG (beta-lactamase superfamily)